jgi:predicted 3-demethylubiquinone-9 3-methyltransferase (glyoxalase superfamily)
MPAASMHLMFEGTASAALELYGSVFDGFMVDSVERYGAGEGGAEGSIRMAAGTLYGQRLIVIDSPIAHQFSFTPSMSLFIDLDDASSLDAAFAALSAGGAVLMPLDDYGFSRRFGWCTDRFGVSWQLNLP